MSSTAWLDEMKATIYEDYLRSIAQVRQGADPELMFLSHEKRVAPLREVVAAAEAETARSRMAYVDYRTEDLSKKTASGLHA